MTCSVRQLTLAVLCAAPFGLHAESAVDPSGHWEGAVYVPAGEIPFALDVARGADGQIVATFDNPGEKLDGFPFSGVAVSGRSVKLEVKLGGAAPQTFDGTVSADGQTLSGDLLVDLYAVPFSFKRTGAAQLAPPPRSPAIEATFAGEWTGSLDVGGRSLPVTLTLANRDGGATGSWVHGTGGVDTPFTIAQDGRTLTLASTVAPAEFKGTLSGDGAQIVGTLTDDGSAQPLTFRRAAAR
jgi:hypothetical protein